MTDSIAAASSLPDGQEPQRPQDLETLSAKTEAEEIRGSNFNSLAENALNSALKEIGNANAVDVSRDGLTGAAPNAVDDAKNGFVSDVARPGSETAVKDSAEETLRAVEGRAKNLYGEMMVHHIAWGVAQRMQKDMSQLLRGS